jgi:hypothetical protein
MLKRRSGLKRQKKGLKRSRLRPVSKKRSALNKYYLAIRAGFLKNHPRCEMPGCSRFSQDIHHKAGRLDGNLINVLTFMAVCRNCHSYIHDHPSWSREKFYLV